MLLKRICTVIAVGLLTVCQLQAQSGQTVLKTQAHSGPAQGPFVALKYGEEFYPITMDLIAGIEPVHIAKMEVFKNEEAVSHFGEKAEGGAIIFTLKNTVTPHVLEGLKWRAVMQKVLSEPRYLTQEDFDKNGNLNPVVTFIGIKTKGGLIPVTEMFALAINPAWISEVEVLENQESIKRFGQKGKKGAILISIREEQEQEVLKSIKK